MKKIWTLFERDWTNGGRTVTRDVAPGCEWVTQGEGWATRKLDGACCYIDHDDARSLYKRREISRDAIFPMGFEPLSTDEGTGKTVGWQRVDAIDPADKWFREGYANLLKLVDTPTAGTYELIGPKVQGNSEHSEGHQLVPHGSNGLLLGAEVPRDYDGLRQWLRFRDIEGIVYHHADGRMVKIKKRDFGLSRFPADDQQPTPEPRVPRRPEQADKPGEWPPGAPTLALPLYRCHKLVQAAPITEIVPAGCYVDQGGGNGYLVIVPDNFAARGGPAIGDYLVRYEDGYLSWSPKAVFEAGYKREAVAA